MYKGEMAERSKALESGGSSTFDHNAHVSSPKGRGFESHFRHLFFCYFISSFLKCTVFLSVHENIRPKCQPTLIRETNHFPMCGIINII